MKLLVLSSVIAAALGAPDAEADADAFYRQYQWPGAYGVGPYGHGFSSTCYGCRPYGHYLGKRDADADPDAFYGVYGGYRGLYGLPYARAYGYGPGIAHHGTGLSFSHRSVQGLPHHLGKRDADADADADASPDADADADAHYGYYGYGLGVAHHPYGLARSYVGPTVYGYPGYRYGYYGHPLGHFGKRSAEPEPHGVVAPLHHPVGVAGHPGPATSYVGRTVFGYPSLHYGKRSADADADADADAHYGLYGYGGYGYGFPGGYTHVAGLAHYRPYAYGLGPYWG